MAQPPLKNGPPVVQANGNVSVWACMLQTGYPVDKDGWGGWGDSFARSP